MITWAPQEQALASSSVRVAGWVEDLLPLYRSSRVGVAPLRYGAGVKGKVGESLSLGLPMVMTTIAAEGMHVEDGVQSMVADDPDGFADRIVVLMEHDALWAAVSARGRELISERFGPGAAKTAILQSIRATDQRRLAPVEDWVPA